MIIMTRSILSVILKLCEEVGMKRYEDKRKATINDMEAKYVKIL